MVLHDLCFQASCELRKKGCEGEEDGEGGEKERMDDENEDATDEEAPDEPLSCLGELDRELCSQPVPLQTESELSLSV